MISDTKKNTEVTATNPTTFDIHVCSQDGRLLSEYTLTQHDDNVTTLSAAVHRAEQTLLDNYGEALVIVVSEQTLTKLRQTQLLVTPIRPTAKQNLHNQPIKTSAA
jgi:hypothetical protein